MRAFDWGANACTRPDVLASRKPLFMLRRLRRPLHGRAGGQGKLANPSFPLCIVWLPGHVAEHCYCQLLEKGGHPAPSPW